MRLFLPQFREYRSSAQADRALDTQEMDEAFAKLAALINGNLDASNIAKTARFPATAFLESYSVVSFRGVHSTLTSSTPTNIVMGSIPTILNSATIVPIAVSGILFYSAVPASTPTWTVVVGATTVATGTATFINTTSRTPTQTIGTPNPSMWWKLGEEWDPRQNYQRPTLPTNYNQYKIFSNFFSSGVTPATGNTIYATFTPTAPDLQSFIDITFKVRHVS